jgi:hypothetical protein
MGLAYRRGERETMFGRGVRESCANTLAKPPLAASDAKTGQKCVPLAPRDSRVECVRLAPGVASHRVLISGAEAMPQSCRPGPNLAKAQNLAK